MTTAIGTSDGAGALALQPDGKIVAAGGSVVGGREVFALARYNREGSLDTSFGSGGTVATAIHGSYAAGVDAIGVQPDGKVVVAGYGYTDSTEEFVLARYNANGSLDTSFGSGGQVRTAIGPEVVANALVLQPDGKIVAAGGSIYGGGGGFALARYNANGSLDTSFGSGGTETTAIGPVEDNVRALALQPDGRIVAAGYSSTSDSGLLFAVARFDANGSLDTSFGSGARSRRPSGTTGRSRWRCSRTAESSPPALALSAGRARGRTGSGLCVTTRTARWTRASATAAR